MTQFSDDLYLGNAYIGGARRAGPSPSEVGVGPLGRIFIYDIVPVAGGTALCAALQTLGAAGNLTLAAGAGVAAIVNTFGEAVLEFDVSRCVTLSSTGALSGINFTATGRDRLGRLMTSTIAGPSNNTVAFPKAFKQLVSIAADAAVGTNTSAGINDAFGLPWVMPDAAYVISVKWDATLADNAGTFVAADTATPSPTTGDARGVYTPAGNAANGARRLVMAMALRGIAVGPDATTAGAVGASQF